jgi:hypothetical protein
MIKRSVMLWCWALIGVPAVCGLVARLSAPALFAGLLPAVAANAPPIVCVLSGLVATHYAVRPEAGRVRRSVFYVVYTGGMFCLCALISTIVTMEYANL